MAGDKAKEINLSRVDWWLSSKNARARELTAIGLRQKRRVNAVRAFICFVATCACLAFSLINDHWFIESAAAVTFGFFWFFVCRLITPSGFLFVFNVACMIPMALMLLVYCFSLGSLSQEAQDADRLETVDTPMLMAVGTEKKVTVSLDTRGANSLKKFKIDLGLTEDSMIDVVGARLEGIDFIVKPENGVHLDPGGYVRKTLNETSELKWTWSVTAEPFGGEIAENGQVKRNLDVSIICVDARGVHQFIPGVGKQEVVITERPILSLRQLAFSSYLMMFWLMAGTPIVLMIMASWRRRRLLSMPLSKRLLMD